MTNSEEHTYDELLISKVLSLEANAEEIQAFQEKCKSNSHFHSMYFEMKEMWENSEALIMIEGVDLNKAVAKLIARINKAEEKQKKHFHIATWLVSLAATILFGFILYKTVLYNSRLEIITSNNVAKIILPDSSQVCINKNSSFSYPKTFKSASREVILNGEAYFIIKANTAQPFIVTTKSACVKVLGTSFNVNSSPGQVTVSVTNGNVKLYARNRESNQVKITKGESGSLLTKDQSVSKVAITDPNYNSWATGTFKFDRTPLPVALKILGAYYQTKISLQNKNLYNCKITAVISNQSLSAVLQILEMTFDLKTIKKDSIILTGNGCEP